MNFSERMADLFVHGQLVADLMEDGTKAIFALAAVSVANIFWTEQQESEGQENKGLFGIVASERL